MHRIAIIADKADSCSLLAHCFACEGFQVTPAANGEVGLDIVRRFHPDLVILDLLLPNRSGWDVCRRLKRLPGVDRTKVAMLTLEANAAYRVGADGYLVKGGKVEPTLPPIRVFRFPAQGILGEFLHRRAIAA